MMRMISHISAAPSSSTWRVPPGDECVFFFFSHLDVGFGGASSPLLSLSLSPRFETCFSRLLLPSILARGQEMRLLQNMSTKDCSREKKVPPHLVQSVMAARSLSLSPSIL